MFHHVLGFDSASQNRPSNCQNTLEYSYLKLLQHRNVSLMFSPPYLRMPPASEGVLRVSGPVLFGAVAPPQVPHGDAPVVRHGGELSAKVRIEVDVVDCGTCKGNFVMFIRSQNCWKLLMLLSIWTGREIGNQLPDPEIEELHVAVLRPGEYNILWSSIQGFISCNT